jgi:vesicular inhibitory amino acid transporter
MDIKGKQPSTWDQYDGVQGASVGSQGSRVQWDELERRPSEQSASNTGAASAAHGTLRRRR